MLLFQRERNVQPFDNIIILYLTLYKIVPLLACRILVTCKQPCLAGLWILPGAAIFKAVLTGSL